MIVGVVKYGVGNIGSVVNALRRIGVDSIIVKSCSEVDKCDIILLPGVGSFDAAINYIRRELPCIYKLKGYKPVIGICLGMQIMFERSEEGVEKGLCWYSGKVELLKSRIVPHMGWNSVRILKVSELTSGLPEEPYFYFAHSYCVHENYVSCSVKLGITNFENSTFASIIFDEKNLILGTQFHPERSSKNGLKLLTNFINMCRR